MLCGRWSAHSQSLQIADESQQRVQSIGSPVHLPADRCPIPLTCRQVHAAVFEVAGENSGSNVRLERKVGVLLERDAKRFAIRTVVTPTSDLDKSAPVLATP